MTVVVEIGELRALIVRRLGRQYSAEDAERMAGCVLFGELVGRASHGIARLLPGSYGPMDDAPGGPPQTTRTGPGTARIVGGPGMLVASLATSLVAELAAGHGMAVVTATGSHSTSGSLTYYVEQLTERQLVALVVANAAAFVAPPGGTERLLGTNPLAVGVPATGYPVIADMATSATPAGEVLAAAAAGAALPPGVAVDVRGRPTTDPRAMLDGGAILPFGGHKGLALSMTVQLLSGVFGGSATLPLGPADDWGHMFIAISLGAIGEPERMRRDAQTLIDRLRATTTRGDAELRIPGHRTLARRDAALARGTVEVDAGTLEQLTRLL
jgi:LDH2 family malate/lactate/ureidoglycolate dehydrogenase